MKSLLAVVHVHTQTKGGPPLLNKAANDAKGLHSPGMIHVIGHFNDDGSETLCDYWIKIVP